MRPPEYDLPRRLARLEKVELHHHTTGGQEIRPGFAGSLDQMRPRGSHGILMESMDQNGAGNRKSTWQIFQR